LVSLAQAEMCAVAREQQRTSHARLLLTPLGGPLFVNQIENAGAAGKPAPAPKALAASLEEVDFFKTPELR